MAETALLRQLPKMDILLEAALAQPRFAETPRGALTDALREALSLFRAELLSGAPLPTQEAILARAAALLTAQQAQSCPRVLNATGVLLHTNLGRAPLAREAAEAAYIAGAEYTALEFDRAAGKRGDRCLEVEALLQRLLNVESALAVNNNAAAVLLALTVLAKGREVVVSRGELVEIGGAFRVPEVMEQSGCTLREVGTTNKTHLKDYQRAIGERTGALLKVHTSNYRIVGFTGSVSAPELAKLAHERELPLLYDLGGGSMLPLAPYGVRDEPILQEVAQSGADVICFSGDKLLGGPQAGIIIGKKRYIDAMKAHPLLRALRLDKMTLSALEATLRLYLYPEEARRSIPLYRMLEQPIAELEAKAERLLALLPGLAGVSAHMVESRAEIGAGCVPCETLPSRAVRIEGAEPEGLYHRLLMGNVPVVARIHKGGLLLDMRTVDATELETLADALCAALEA